MFLTLNFGDVKQLFDVNNDWDVLFVKLRACQIFNLNADNYFLSLSNVPLDESQKLSDLKLTENCNVFVRSRILKNHFFVFCYTCKDICPASMKFFCDLCNAPKFTPVLYDHESNTCRGKCSSESCLYEQGKVAFFCINSDTHVDKVFLNQCERNLSFITCAACCSNSSDIIFKFCKDESHYVCIDCFKNYATEFFESGCFQLINDIGYTIGCPAGCENAFIEDAHHFRVLGAEFYSRYKEQAAARYVNVNNFVFCPNCGMNWETNDIINVNSPVWHNCLLPEGCGVLFCSVCNWFINNIRQEGESSQFTCFCQSKPRSGFGSKITSTLSTVWNSLKLTGGDVQSKALIANVCRSCPKCKSPTEKNGGCNHIHCSVCGTDWCWICRDLWDGDCQSSHWF